MHTDFYARLLSPRYLYRIFSRIVASSFFTKHKSSVENRLVIAFQNLIAIQSVIKIFSFFVLLLSCDCFEIVSIFCNSNKEIVTPDIKCDSIDTNLID